MFYEVKRKFEDAGVVRTEGEIITLEEWRVPALVRDGFVMPIPRESVQSLLKAINDKTGSPDVLWGKSNKTVLAYANATYQHIHMPGYVYPYDGSLITPTTANAAGDFGDFVEAVPEGVIEAPFDTHWITVTDISNTGVYVCELHIVDDTDLQDDKLYLTSFSVARGTNFDRSAQVSVQMPPVPAGARVGARVLNNQTGTHSISFNIHYHEYE